MVGLSLEEALLGSAFVLVILFFELRGHCIGALANRKHRMLLLYRHRDAGHSFHIVHGSASQKEP